MGGWHVPGFLFLGGVRLDLVGARRGVELDVVLRSPIYGVRSDLTTTTTG